MKRLLLISVLLFTFSCLHAWEYVSEETRSETTAQLRLDISYNLPLHKTVTLNFFEDIRFDLYPFSPKTLFDLSLTSVTLVYSPIKYLKLDAGYMLKIIGAATEATWERHFKNPNTFIKHRIYFGITGTYSVEGWRFTLRERLLDDMRFDDIDMRTTNRHALTLRHYVSVSYNIKSHRLSPYVWTELANTLNEKEYSRLGGRQYLERWRTAVGIKYKLPERQTSEGQTKSRGTLNFFYRYDWGRFRSAKLQGEDAKLTTRRKNEHAIGIAYEL